MLRLLFILLLFPVIVIIIIDWSNYSDKPKEYKLDPAIEVAISDISRLYFDSVVALMIYGKLNYKESVLELFLKRPDINDIFIVRNPVIYKNDNVGVTEDRLSNKVFLEDKKTLYEWHLRTDIVSVAVPMIVTENTRGANCTICHKVEIGTVLGVLRIEYSIVTSDYKNVDDFKSKVRHHMCKSVLPTGVC